MARYREAKCKLCRREGGKLFLKGDKCYMEKCPFNKRPVAPGQHGADRKKVSEYGLQLREKQKTKRYYGVLENQFRGYFEKADNQDGVTGENLLSLLERRLDNVVYRMGLASSRREARQLVLHAHFTLNGKKVNIPSLIVKVGDEIALKDNVKSLDKFAGLIENMQSHVAPAWLDLNKEKAAAKVVALPKREDIDFPFDEQLIVELYSK